MEYLVGRITPQDYKYYMSYWEKLVPADREQIFGGEEAMYFFTLSQLNCGILRKIWFLSDFDCDSKLTSKEFCIAMHLVVGVVNDCIIPEVLPKYLLEFLEDSIRGENTTSGYSSLPQSQYLSKQISGSQYEGKQTGAQNTTAQTSRIDAKNTFQRLESSLKNNQSGNTNKNSQTPTYEKKKFQLDDRMNGAVNSRETLGPSPYQNGAMQRDSESSSYASRNLQNSMEAVRISTSGDEGVTQMSKQRLMNEALKRCNNDLARVLNGLIQEKEQLLMELEKLEGGKHPSSK